MNYLNVRLVKSAVAGVLAGWLLAGCSSGYSLAGVEGGRVAITDVYEGWPLLMCTTVNRMPKR